MSYNTVIVKKGFFSKEWANDLLRWFLKEILYADCWIRHPYNKILIADEIIDRLNEKGYPWQAARVKNHLHRWMSSISEDPRSIASLAPQSGDTLAGEREASL